VHRPAVPLPRQQWREPRPLTRRVGFEAQHALHERAHEHRRREELLRHGGIERPIAVTGQQLRVAAASGLAVVSMRAPQSAVSAREASASSVRRAWTGSSRLNAAAVAGHTVSVSLVRPERSTPNA
jgi:hypothetical protein